MKEAPCRARCCPRGRPGIGGRDHGELSPPFAGKLRLRNDRDCHCTIDVSTPQQIEASHFLPSVLTLRPRPSSNQPLAAGDHFDHTAQLQSPLRTILTVRWMEHLPRLVSLEYFFCRASPPHVSPSFYSNVFVNRSARVKMHLRSRHSRQLWRRGGW